MISVKNKDVIKYFDTDRTASVKVTLSKIYEERQIHKLNKASCTCSTQAAIKVCRANSDSVENNKINYDG